MKTIPRQTKIVWLLCFVQMCKFFSHFGVRTLLILYLVQHLRYGDSQAFGVNAVFCGLSELAAILGGILADRYLGLRRSVLFGGLLLSLGYCSLFIDRALFLSMGLVIVGSSLFSSNITALLGAAYEEKDPLRKKGFTLFYMVQNLGALLATLLCGVVATCVGFQASFLVASMGMVAGSITLFLFRSLLEGLDVPPTKGKQVVLPGVILGSLLLLATLGAWAGERVLLGLPWLTAAVLAFFAYRLLQDKRWPKIQIYRLLIYLAALVLFFAVEDQICSSLLLFAEREVSRSFFGLTIPSSFITLLNPIVIMVLGTWVGKNRFPMATPFMITGGAFAVIAACCLLNLNCSILGVMGMVSMISLAELMIGPLVLSQTSEIAGKRSSGMMMGMVPIAFSLAYQTSGGLSKLMAVGSSQVSLSVYGKGFVEVALLLLVGGGVIHLLIKRFACEKNLVY